MLSPLRDFLATESSGALLLAFGAVVALVWANSPWSGSYEALWSSRGAITIAGHTLDLDLRHWVNDGLMTIFFLVVGLEIKRELSEGHLASPRAALLPGAAALGGMVVPALVYLVIAGGTAPRGWAIPMATDIALAVGVLAVAGDRVPGAIRAFLLGLAIVDDIGAIVIIAVFYSAGVDFVWLLMVAVGVALTVAAGRLGVHLIWIYCILGTFVWFALHEGGVHPTIAGVAMGLLAPATPRLSPDLIDSDQLADLSDVDAAHESSELAKGSVSVVEWLLYVLHPWTSYVIVPLFALANSGISLSATGFGDAFRSPITWGVLLGLLLGKPLGVVFAARSAVRLGLADAPAAGSPRHLAGIGAVAGIGFTVAIFIAELAFVDAADQSNAKLAILVASVMAAIASTAILRKSEPTSAS
jgi:NhaA family Na+:H+ antiporter